MSLDLKKVPEHILDDLRSRGHSDDAIARMNAAKAFDEYLSWNGIIGYGSSVRAAVHALDAAEVKS
jgi:hypothetical protein